MPNQASSLPAKRAVRIAIDAMGGDHAPEINIKGALAALLEKPDLEVVLVGDEAIVRGEVSKHAPSLPANLHILHAEETISMEDHGAAVIRKKKRSSIHVGLSLLKSGDADAFISAGNSGAVMAGAFFILGRIADIERPAILVRMPTAEGHAILLDVGANVDCKPLHLMHFAEMGSLFAEVIEGVPKPKVGLLSNGSESHKGNELTRETHELLSLHPSMNYVGYVEGFDVFRGTAHVVVCDGFVGNVVLKLAEGLAETAFQWFRSEIRRDVLGLVGVVLMKRIFRRFKAKFDYQPYGAAPLLGINGLVLISHGSSTEVAIRNGILTAVRGVEERFTEKMITSLERLHGRSENKKPQETL